MGDVPNQLLVALSTGERDRLLSFLEPVELPLRSVVASTGEPVAFVVFPTTAVLSTVVEMPDGDAIEVGLTGAEGFAGIDLLYRVGESAMTVIVQAAGSGLRMRADDFEREVLERDGELSRLLLRYVRSFSAVTALSGACNATHRLEQRLARWLLMMQDRVNSDEWRMTHEFVAVLLGVRRAGVTESMNALRENGSIDYARGVLRIVDRRKLEASACECYGIIRGWSQDLSTARR